MDVLAKTVDHICRHAWLRTGIGEVHEIEGIDLCPIDETAHVFEFFIVVNIGEGIVGGQIEKGYVVVKGGTGSAPVARTFVTTTILGIRVEEIVEDSQNFSHGFCPLVVIFFKQ